MFQVFKIFKPRPAPSQPYKLSCYDCSVSQFFNLNPRRLPHSLTFPLGYLWVQSIAVGLPPDMGFISWWSCPIKQKLPAGPLNTHIHFLSFLLQTVIKQLPACILHLCKAIEKTTPRVNLYVKYGLWITMMCQCLSVFKTKSLWWGMLTMREDMRLSGQKGKSLCLWLTFAVNIKLH